MVKRNEDSTKEVNGSEKLCGALYIKRGDVRRAIANHETVKGVDRIVEEESMKELFKDETYIQENVDVVLLERPKTIKIST